MWDARKVAPRVEKAVRGSPIARGQASLGIERSLGSFLELKSRWMPRWDQGPVKSKQ